MIRASIITIGNELLIGQVIDTNSAYIAQKLNEAGIWLQERISVGDNKADITNALDACIARSKIVLLTGGLGPTSDDITKPLLCEYFGGRLVQHQPTVTHLKELFEKYLKRVLTERNMNQAMLPDVCEVVPNHLGTAPGMQFEKNGVLIISMPGVPAEMIMMMDKYIIPALKIKYQLPPFIHRTATTYGISESNLADLLVNFEEQLPADIDLAYLPNFGINRLRLTTKSNTGIKAQFSLLTSLVKDFLLTDRDESVVALVSRLAKEKYYSLSSAESCTGGNLSLIHI